MTAEKDSRSKSEPARPEYLTIPTPSPNGKDAASQPLGVHSIETAARPEPSVKDPTDAVVEAAGAVFKALAARLAYHEKQAQRVREALMPFATMLRQNAAPSSDADSGDTLTELLKIAQRARIEGEL